MPRHSSDLPENGDAVDRDDRAPAIEPDEIVAGPAASSPIGLDPAALIQSLGGGQVDPLSLLLSQLSARAGDDPSLAMMNQLILQRRASDQTTAESEPEADADREARQAETEERLAELTALAERLFGEAEALRERCGELADAVGACRLCFGSDLLCAECGGRGRPGARAPKPDVYRVYVLPAVARVKALMDARASNAPAARPARPASNSYSTINEGTEHARHL